MYLITDNMQETLDSFKEELNNDQGKVIEDMLFEFETALSKIDQFEGINSYDTYDDFHALLAFNATMFEYINQYTVQPCKDDLYVLSCLVGTAHKYWKEFNRRRKLASLYVKEADLKFFVHNARHKTYTTEEDKQYGRDLDKISEEIYKLEQETSWRRK